MAAEKRRDVVLGVSAGKQKNTYTFMVQRRPPSALGVMFLGPRTILGWFGLGILLFLTRPCFSSVAFGIWPKKEYE